MTKAVARTTTGLRIGAYIRVSTEEQAENPEGSIKSQEMRLRETVKLRNMEGNFGKIEEMFIDRAKSGKDTNRPELQRLLLAIRRKEIDLVLVSELSRLSRSIKDFSEMWELMKSMGCNFMSLRENFDTTTAAGEMVLYLTGQSIPENAPRRLKFSVLLDPSYFGPTCWVNPSEVGS